LATGELGRIDAVLLSHDQHADNLDPAGRRVLVGVGAVVTTPAGARRLGGDAVGLESFESTRLEHPERPTLTVTGTPCRHGPPFFYRLSGPTTGFALEWEGQAGGVLWISGDTVLYDGVREVPERLDVDTAVLHLGAVRFPVTGPLRYSMTGAEAVELCLMLQPNTVIPVHYEGWKHFHEGRAQVERAFADTAVAQPTWLEPGRPTQVN
jgi:L-ascorbate metabolism protein UlaG (beta-lactamase superfamily)